MRVIRVEYTDRASTDHEGTAIGEGAYSSVNVVGYASSLGAALSSHGCATAQSHQPMHYNDERFMSAVRSKNMLNTRWMYCFSSLQQYHMWFNQPVLRRQCAHIGRLAVYDILDKFLAIGDAQSVADSEHVTLLHYLPLDYEGEV